MMRLPENIAKTIVRPNVVVEFYCDSPLSAFPLNDVSSPINAKIKDCIADALSSKRFSVYAFISTMYVYHSRPVWSRGVLSALHSMPLELDTALRNEVSDYIADVFTKHPQTSIHAVVRRPDVPNFAPYYE